MRSYFDGYGLTRNTKYHMVQFFDGQRIREISLTVYCHRISYIEREIPGVIEEQMDYRTAKRRLAAYEERCTRRIG